MRARWIPSSEMLVVLLTGALFGGLGVALSYLGNPVNSGLCISCFMENSAGALGLHANERMQYFRPELLGFVLGAFALSLVRGEFRSRGGARAMPFFFSGFFLIVGSSVFIGCPIKLMLRLGAGDWTSLAGFAGLAAGVALGTSGMKRGTELPAGELSAESWGLMLPLLALLGLAGFFLAPDFFLSSSTGSASVRAAPAAALGISLLLGAMAQRSRFCITGALRDGLLLGWRSPLLRSLVLMLLVIALANLAGGSFRGGFFGQPGAHQDYLWSFLGMALVGWLSVLVGGCPFRQLVRAGQGDLDAAMAVLGMLLAGALVQSWGISASAAGVPLYGKVAVLIGFLFLFSLALTGRVRA